MASINGMYNPEAEASKDFAPIPTGEYLVVIDESDMDSDDGGERESLKLVHSIVDGEFKGRKIWHYLKFKNPSQQAVDIANREFASIREATGVTNPTKSEQLHFKPMVVRLEFIKEGTVKTSKAGKAFTYKRDTNEIKSWKKPEGAVTVATGTNAANAGAQNESAPAADSTPPWQRNKAA